MRSLICTSVMLALLLVACSEDRPPGEIETYEPLDAETQAHDARALDAGRDAVAPDAEADTSVGPGPELQLAAATPDGIEPLTEGSTLEIVSGFQGGWHIELGLIVRGGLQEEQMTGLLEWRVDEAEAGKVLAAERQLEFDPFFWSERGDDLVFTLPQTILEISEVEEAVGATAEIDVLLEFDDAQLGPLRATARVELVDEVDELGM